MYPLTRIFYDAVTDETGRITLANFSAFFNDGFYLRALWKSLVLGRGHGGRLVGHRHRGGFPSRALRLPRPPALQLSHPDSHHLAAPRGDPGLHLHPGPGGLDQCPAHGHLRHAQAHQLSLRDPRRRARGDPPPLPHDHPQRGGRPRQDRPRPRGGRGERGGPRLEEIPDGDPAADDPGLRGGRAPRLHLDLFRFRHPAHPGRPGPPRRPGLSQHRAVRGPPHLSHGHRHLRAHGAPRHRLPPRGPPLGRAQGLLHPVVFRDRAPAPLRRPARAARWAFFPS